MGRCVARVPLFPLQSAHTHDRRLGGSIGGCTPSNRGGKEAQTAFKIEQTTPSESPWSHADSFPGKRVGIERGRALSHVHNGQRHGDILYTHILNQEIIVMNSEEVAVELLEKRSRKYSDRRVVATADFHSDTGLAGSSILRLHAIDHHHFFHAGPALSYRPRRLQTAYEILTRILDDATHYAEHFYTTRGIVRDTNGGEAFTKSLKRAADVSTRLVTPGSAAFFTAFPCLKKLLPAWFPFMGFKSEAAKCAKLANDGLHGSYAWVKQQVDKGITRSSLVADAATRYRLEDDFTDPFEFVFRVDDVNFVKLISSTSSLWHSFRRLDCRRLRSVPGPASPLDFSVNLSVSWLVASPGHICFFQPSRGRNA
ncbi:hypothetical protein BDN67DRAFT_1011839 [Paxillus ammoniavirescens]|nr:hypothetical protein BDN67DRAFT_1011839 [Paxillus ammoniavirescens]